MGRGVLNDVHILGDKIQQVILHGFGNHMDIGQADGGLGDYEPDAVNILINTSILLKKVCGQTISALPEFARHIYNGQHPLCVVSVV